MLRAGVVFDLRGPSDVELGRWKLTRSGEAPFRSLYSFDLDSEPVTAAAQR